MLIGYARVSTGDQNLDLQNDALKKAGCEQMFTDTLSGAKASRPGLDECLSYARRGDTLVVWKLDRLGRSLKNLIETVRILDERGIGFKSLQENIDTTTPGGKLVFHVFGALAEFERDLVRERTHAGLQAARARGRVGGRPFALDAKKRDVARALHSNKDISITEICRSLGVSRATFYRSLGEVKVQPPSTMSRDNARPKARASRPTRAESQPVETPATETTEDAISLTEPRANTVALTSATPALSHLDLSSRLQVLEKEFNRGVGEHAETALRRLIYAMERQKRSELEQKGGVDAVREAALCLGLSELGIDPETL